MNTFQAKSTITTAALPDPNRRNWLWWILQILVWISSRLWLGVWIRGSEKIPSQGGGLLLINHQSYLDVPLVGAWLHRPVSFVARKTLYRIGWLRWVMNHTYVLPIDRDGTGTDGIRAALQRLRHGFLLALFPEGTRSLDGELGPFRPGVIAILRRTNFPIYPLGISGTFEALPRGSFFVRPKRVRIVVGTPIRPEEIKPLCGRGNEEKLMQFLHDRVEQCHREADNWRRRKN